MLNSVSVFNQVTPEDMLEEQKKDPILRLICLYITIRERLKSSAIAKIKSKAVWKYSLQFNKLTFKQGSLHHICINNECRIPPNDPLYQVSSAAASNVT